MYFKFSLKVCRRALFKIGGFFDCCLFRSILLAAVPEAGPAIETVLEPNIRCQISCLLALLMVGMGFCLKASVKSWCWQVMSHIEPHQCAVGFILYHQGMCRDSCLQENCCCPGTAGERGMPIAWRCMMPITAG